MMRNVLNFHHFCIYFKKRPKSELVSFRFILYTLQRPKNYQSERRSFYLNSFHVLAGSEPEVETEMETTGSTGQRCVFYTCVLNHMKRLMDWQIERVQDMCAITAVSTVLLRLMLIMVQNHPNVFRCVRLYKSVCSSVGFFDRRSVRPSARPSVCSLLFIKHCSFRYLSVAAILRIKLFGMLVWSFHLTVSPSIFPSIYLTCLAPKLLHAETISGCNRARSGLLNGVTHTQIE